MQIDLHRSVAAFLASAGPRLMRDEAGHNVLLANAHLLAAGDHPFAEPYFLASVRDGRRVVGAALRTPPDSLNVTALPADVLPDLVAAVCDEHPSLPSVAGPADVAAAFAEHWSAATGRRAALRHAWQLYVLTAVEDVPPRRAGHLRVAAAADLPQLRAWSPRYAEAFNTRVDVTAYLERMVERGSLYLWDDAGPKCLVSLSGRTPNGIRVSAVYTPDEYRRLGYATAAVAAASRVALDGGYAFLTLFAETSDPTANGVYRRVGYVPVAEHAMIDLDLEPAPS